MAPKEKVNTKNTQKDEVLTRIAIVSDDRCKPKKCRQEVSKTAERAASRCFDASRGSRAPIGPANRIGRSDGRSGRSVGRIAARWLLPAAAPRCDTNIKTDSLSLSSPPPSPSPQQQCKKSCPVVKVGKLCIEVAPTSKVAWISEELCIGCGICVKVRGHTGTGAGRADAAADALSLSTDALTRKTTARAAAPKTHSPPTNKKQKCPFDAIMIINLPKNLENHTTHRYGPNAFKLHRMPMPRPGQVLGACCPGAVVSRALRFFFFFPARAAAPLSFLRSSRSSCACAGLRSHGAAGAGHSPTEVHKKPPSHDSPTQPTRTTPPGKNKKNAPKHARNKKTKKQKNKKTKQQQQASSAPTASASPPPSRSWPASSSPTWAGSRTRPTGRRSSPTSGAASCRTTSRGYWRTG